MAIKVNFYNRKDVSDNKLLSKGTIIFDEVDHSIKLATEDNGTSETWEKYSGDITSTNDYITIEDTEDAKQITANVIPIHEVHNSTIKPIKYIVNDGVDEGLSFERDSTKDFDYNGVHYYVFMCNKVAPIGIEIEQPQVNSSYVGIYKDILDAGEEGFTTTIVPTSIEQMDGIAAVDGLASTLDIKNYIDTKFSSIEARLDAIEAALTLK